MDCSHNFITNAIKFSYKKKEKENKKRLHVRVRMTKILEFCSSDYKQNHRNIISSFILFNLSSRAQYMDNQREGVIQFMGPCCSTETSTKSAKRIFQG